MCNTILSFLRTFLNQACACQLFKKLTAKLVCVLCVVLCMCCACVVRAFICLCVHACVCGSVGVCVTAPEAIHHIHVIMNLYIKLSKFAM